MNPPLGTTAAEREWLERERRRLDKKIGPKAPIRELLADQAALIDTVLENAWRRQVPQRHRLALIPIGGYGRGEMFPGSDVDLLILHRQRLPATAAAAVESFLRGLWDLGLKVGQAVRTVAGCRDLARADVTALTALMESRRLAGDPELYRQLRSALSPERIWPLPRYLDAKRDEQATRHARYDGTTQNLEPDVKEAPGGLRDVQMLNWITLRCYGSAELKDLIRHDLMTPEELHGLRASHELNMRLRYLLHCLAERRQDRLLFDMQPTVAERFGYTGKGNLAVQRFMHDYYRATNHARLMNELLLQRFAEGPGRRRRWLRRRRINDRYNAVNARLEVTSAETFHAPDELLEPFLLLQRRRGLTGLSAETVRRLREALPVAAGFPGQGREAFLELLRRPRAGAMLCLMHRYGLLSALLPPFEHIGGLMQFDMFHVYTVDEHSLKVLEHIDRFSLPPNGSTKFPLCHELMERLPRIELLRLAALFHDIAKGRGGDHSKLGAVDAHTYCRRLGLNDYDTELVTWLVRHHLLMSHTAMRKDLDDTAAIHRFASRVGSAERLHYLYLLTVADISGTNPTLWNGWKAHLLENLYHQALTVLRLNLQDPQAGARHADEARRQAQALLHGRAAAVKRLWDGLGPEYFTRYRPEELAWHAEAISAHEPGSGPLVAVHPRPLRGCTEVFIHMQDVDHVFSVTVSVFDHLNLSVQDARVITGENGYTLDSYSVLEEDGRPVHETWRRLELIAALKKALGAAQLEPRPVSTRLKPHERAANIDTRVAFMPDTGPGRTVLQVITADRRGLLCRVGAALTSCGVRIRGARIATFGNRVEDLFFISDRDNRPLNDAVLRRHLVETVRAALDTQS